jgi:uncharacterized protein involved in response to NO
MNPEPNLTAALAIAVGVVLGFDLFRWVVGRAMRRRELELSDDK